MDIKAIILVTILVNIFFGAWTVINKDLFFHTDIARDFLILEEIVTKKRLTLIGPRAGVPGLFHGPLWPYLNLPAFWLGKGNPVIVGWFWVLLTSLSLPLVYLLGNKFAGSFGGLLSALLLSTINVQTTRNLFNPHGALFLSPLFLYLYWQYTEKQQGKYLVAALVCLGAIIQFQMAFGLPLLILTILHFIFLAYRQKHWRHLPVFLTLLVPFSTFILFDLRHNFLQLRSGLFYLTNNQDASKLPLNKIVTTRLYNFFISVPGLLSGETRWLTPLVLLILISLPVIARRRQDLSNRKGYDLFYYFYIGFWLLTLFFRGTVWSFYYWPWQPIVVAVFTSALKMIKREWFILVFCLVYLYNFSKGLGVVTSLDHFLDQDIISWQFHHQAAQTIFANAENEFGFYILTPDLYGYSPRYALNYTQKEFPQKKAYPYQKKSITYLLIAPGEDRELKAKLWRENQVKILKEPTTTTLYDNGFQVEKYLLGPEEIAVPSDPDLIQDLRFR